MQTNSKKNPERDHPKPSVNSSEEFDKENVNGNWAQKQKIQKLRTKELVTTGISKSLTKYYWELFEACKGCTELDLQTIVVTIDAEAFWNDCNRFLVDGGYISAKNLLHLKEDTTSLVNLYRLHACHFVTNQIINIETKAKA